ncbi:hypothetical protein [Streptomyces sp. NPDC087437]|uniref:hypothetical protein n=1 Tax=Streptomyces sp. NPDC087437 TaxID=3365789 RepID=UPI003800CC54
MRTTMALNHYDDMVAALLRAGRPTTRCGSCSPSTTWRSAPRWPPSPPASASTTGGEDDHPHLGAALAAVDPATVDDQAFERVLAAFLDTLT